MKIGSIDLSKVDENHFYVGKDGKKFMNIAIMENRNGTDQYGNDGMITQSVSKEDRAKGIKGPIIGNWRRVVSKSDPAPKTAPKAKSASASANPEGKDRVPF